MTENETQGAGSATATIEPFDPWGRWLEQFFEPFGFFPSGAEGRPVSNPVRWARTDVSETPSSYRITSELPGIPKGAVDIRIRGTTVEIEAKAAATSPAPETGALHTERSSATFYRGLELPEPVVGAEAKAQLSDGVLTLEIPKLHPAVVPAEVKVPVA